MGNASPTGRGSDEGHVAGTSGLSWDVASRNPLYADSDLVLIPEFLSAPITPRDTMRRPAKAGRKQGGGRRGMGNADRAHRIARTTTRPVRGSPLAL